MVAPQRGQLEERPAEEKPDLELAILSSASAEEALETESRPESHLALLSAQATIFLDRYGLTADHLRERGISFADFQRLFDMDTSLLWNWARVVAINRVVPHALEAPFRGGRPIWPEGGMAPIHRPAKRTIPAFIDAFTAFTYENLERVFKLTILAFLILDFREANSFSSAVSLSPFVLSNSSRDLYSGGRPGLAFCLGWRARSAYGVACQTGCLFSRNPRSWGTKISSLLRPHASEALPTTSRLNPKQRGPIYGLPFFMGFVPFKEDPIAEHLSEMVATLRWNGTLTAEEGCDIFRAVKAVSQQRGIAGLMATDQLLEIMHGVNFKDFRYLLSKPDELTEDEKDRLLMYLEIKTQALTHLKELSDLSAWGVRGFMLGLKGVKTWLLVNLLTALVNALVEFAYCPNEFKDLEQGDIGPISNTLECFNEYVRIFNQIPGQPVETLTSLIPNVAFPGNQYQLDLSNHGIGNATTLAQILNAFQQNGIELTVLNLSGNLGDISNTLS